MVSKPINGLAIQLLLGLRVVPALRFHHIKPFLFSFNLHRKHPVVTAPRMCAATCVPSAKNTVRFERGLKDPVRYLAFQWSLLRLFKQWGWNQYILRNNSTVKHISADISHVVFLFLFFSSVYTIFKRFFTEIFSVLNLGLLLLRRSSPLFCFCAWVSCIFSYTEFYEFCAVSFWKVEMCFDVECVLKMLLVCFLFEWFWPLFGMTENNNAWWEHSVFKFFFFFLI